MGQYSLLGKIRLNNLQEYRPTIEKSVWQSQEQKMQTINSMKGMQQPQQQFSFTRINQFLIFSKTLGTGSLSAVCRTFLSNDALLLPMMSWGALIRYEETSKRNAAVSILESSPISSRQDFIFFFSSFSLSCVLSSPWFNPWVMVSLQIVQSKGMWR